MKTAIKVIALLNHNRGEDEMPATKKVMYFIDGENIVLRYQAMIEDNWVPRFQPPHENIQYLKDIYLWSWRFPLPFPYPTEVIRANYYTSVWGDESKIDNIRETIKGMKLDTTGNSSNLYPVIRKKSRREIKGKGVDIKMTVDILSNVYQNTVDAICIYTGDGDFTPVVEEVMRAGKQVYICAFSCGLSPLLERTADGVKILDPFLFTPK